jgi:hypothetical protein
MCQERGLGIADPRNIEILGDEDAARVNMGFKTSRSLVIRGDQLIRKGHPRFRADSLGASRWGLLRLPRSSGPP